jgi:hypothetical protein
VLGVDPGGRTRGNIAVEEGVDMGGAGIQPDVDIHLNQVGGNNPDPIRSSFNPACITKFVGFFRNSNSNSATILP